jgi:glucose-1-phosphate thymidylyltransferase
VADSIVLSRAEIAGVGRIEASLVGRDASVHSTDHVSTAHRLVLGDHSSVQIGH